MFLSRNLYSRGTSPLIAILTSSLSLFLLAISINYVEAETVEVKIPKGASQSQDSHFEPKTLTIGKGDTVKWINEDDTLHTVSSGKPSSNTVGTVFDSTYLAAGKSFEHTFKKTAKFDYYCTLHPYMTGKIVVSESSPPPIETAVPKSKKSYQLIIYLDNASPQNAIGDNFKILVYNSNDEPILSAKPNIDFNDDHQKISPPNGYPIIYQSGQYPKDIRVCAQQEYQLNGTTYLHNDCYPIIQNVQKTYWYTTFDYGEIDGFEPDPNQIAKPNETTPATTTITPENNASNLGNILSVNDSTADMIATLMKFQREDIKDLNLSFYHLKDYTFIVSNNNSLCHVQNCKFEFKETDLTPQSGSNDITVSGVMRIDTGEVTKILNAFSRFQPVEERQENGKTIQTVEGTFRIGKEPINDAEYEYNINGTLVTSAKDKILSLQGVQCNGLKDDPNKPIDCNY